MLLALLCCALPVASNSNDGAGFTLPAALTDIADPYHAVLVHSDLQEQAAAGTQPRSGISRDNKQWQITLSAMGRDYNLELTPASLTSETKFIAHDGSLGESSANFGLQLFKGKVEGDENSWVRLALHEGLLTGHMFAFGEMLQIQRTDSIPSTARVRGFSDSALTSLDTQTATVMLKNPELAALNAIHQSIANNSAITNGIPASHKHGNLDYLLFPPKSSGDDTTSVNHSGNQTIAALSQAGTADRFTSLPVTRAIRIGIVVDSLFDEHHNNRGVAQALTIINAVDGIYQQQLGLAIVVDTVRANINPATDPMRDKGGTIEQILDNFRVARVFDNQLPADLTLVHLFTGLRDPDGVIGLGWINTACRTDGYDVSVSTPFAFDTLLAAHEMAHNLGALHDDNPRCESNRTSIMWPRLSGSTSTEFSHCSKNAIAPNIGASCNVDNIDLAVGLQASSAGRNLDDQRRVTMKLRNNDPSRGIQDVSIVARFPPGSRIADAPAYCNSAGLQLRCNLNGLDAGITESVTARIILGSTRTAQWVQLSVLKENFADTIDENNTAALNILTFGSTGASTNINTADAETTVNEFEDQGQAQTFVDGNGGGSSGDAIGGVTPLLLLLMTILAAVRRFPAVITRA